MSRNNNAIKEAFDIYNEVIGMALQSSFMPRESELFGNVIALNEKHLLANLDKALVLFKEDTQGNK